MASPSSKLHPVAGSATKARHIVITSDASVILDHVGATYSFGAEVLGLRGAVTRSHIMWTSEAPRVVSVNARGLATALVPLGSASIVVSSPGAPSELAFVVIAKPSPKTVLVPSSAVVFVMPGEAVLRAGIVPLAQPGSMLVSGSKGGLLAKVTAVRRSGNQVIYATAPTSLAQAFQQLQVDVQSLPTKATLSVSHGRSVLSVDQIQPSGALLPVDPESSPAPVSCSGQDAADQAAGDTATTVAATTTTQAPVGGLVSVTWENPSYSMPVTFSLLAVLDIGLFTVKEFSLEVVANASLDITTGSLSFGVDKGVSFNCTLPVPANIDIPSPIFVGPVELDGSISPAAGVRVEASATGTLSLAGPTVLDTVSATNGVLYSAGTWQSIDDNSSTGLQVTPVGAALTSTLQAAVDPYFSVDAGFSADLAGIYSLAGINLAYAQATGTFGLSLASPFQSDQLGYTGPTWAAGFELQAGPELATNGPVYEEIEAFLGSLGVNLAVNVVWDQYDKKLPLGSSPSPAVSKPPTATTGSPVALIATLPVGFQGDALDFEGFRDGETIGATLASATVSGTTAKATWVPSATQSGSYMVVGLLYDDVFGRFGLPYATAEADAANTTVSATGSSVTTMASGTTAPATTTTASPSTSSPLTTAGTTSTSSVGSSAPAAEPDLVGTWISPPQLNFTAPSTGLKIEVATQSTSGSLAGTIIYYGDGLVVPTQQVPVQGSVVGSRIVLRGQNTEFDGSWALSGSLTVQGTIAINGQSFAVSLYKA